MTEPKKTDIAKIVFAPGCFDNFEGSQEDLDELILEIKSMFEGKTREEIESMSRTVNIDELIDDDPETAEKILTQLQTEEFKNIRH